MSFAKQVKEELCQTALRRLHCRKAELAAIIDVSGSLEISSQGISFQIRTMHANLARHVYRLLVEDFGLVAQLYTRPERLRREHSYLIGIRGGRLVEALYALLSKGDLQAAMLPQSSLPLLGRSCCRHAYLRGAFLAGGSINDPSRGAYHLEIVIESEVHALDLCQIMADFNLHPHRIERKEAQVVYLKDRLEIADFLTRIGAMRNRLQYEEVLMYREMRNNANRQVNFMLANVDRTTAAAARQQSAIQWLQRNPELWRSLSSHLVDVALARIEEPESTLLDLAETLGLSKSAVNHRLRKLCQLAEENGWAMRDDSSRL